MRSYKAEGIIIKRTEYNDADRLLTVFTKEFGKKKIIAKGVRRITSRRSSSIELFNQATLFIHKGKSIDILTEAQVINSFQELRNDLQSIGLAYHICELVDGLCPEDQEHFDIYELLVETLKNISLESVRKFEREILVRLGFWPEDKPIPTDPTHLIEQILDKRLKSRKILTKLS